MLRRIFCVSSLLLLLSPALRAKTVTIGGERPATLLTPASVGSGSKIPLILFLHGYTTNAQQMDSIFGISKQRDALGFALILADGTKNSQGYRFWNATPECCDFENTGVDDAGYLAGLIVEAQKLAPIDVSRVYVIGHSNGGFMSYRMACDYPELIRGIVSISGAFFADSLLCKKPGVLNVLQIHGTADTTIPFEGGNGTPSAQASVGFWANNGSCEAAVSTLGAIDLVRSSGSTTGLKETDSFIWKNCKGSTKVGLWKINGTGHLPYFNSTWLADSLDFVQ